MYSNQTGYPIKTIGCLGSAAQLLFSLIDVAVSLVNAANQPMLNEAMHCVNELGVASAHRPSESGVDLVEVGQAQPSDSLKHCLLERSERSVHSTR